MNEENSRASIRAREAEKAHGIRTFSKGWGAKKKGPNVSKLESFYGAESGTRTHTGY